MTRVLELAQLLQHDMCPRWMSGAVGSMPSFTRSGRPSAAGALELSLQLALGQRIDRVSLQEFRCFAGV